jgi:hypothetical protein
VPTPARLAAVRAGTCTIDEVEEPGGHEAIPRYNFNFRSIPDLEQTPDESKVDVLGVITDATDVRRCARPRDGPRPRARSAA